MATYTKISNISFDTEPDGHLIIKNAENISPELFKLDDNGHLMMMPQTTLEIYIDDDGYLVCKGITDWDLWERYMRNGSGTQSTTSSGGGGGDEPSEITDDWTTWEKYLRSGTDGGGYSDALDPYIEGIMSDPAYQNDAIVDGSPTPILARKDSAQTAKIKAVPGTDIHIGDLVECLDDDWLVKEIYVDAYGIVNGTMWLCNKEIRFQNFSPYINVRKCVVDDGLYRKKTIDPKAYIPTNTYELYLSIDYATEQLFVDKRLALGTIYDSNNNIILDTYKIMGIDMITNNHEDGDHLMVCLIQNDVYDAEHDSIEDLLCNVWVDHERTDSEPSVSGSCVIAGKNTLRIGTTRKYTATFYDKLGDEEPSIQPVWNVDAPDGITVYIGTETVSITVPLDETLIGKEIVMTLTDEDGIYGTFEKRVQVITVG